MPQIIPIKDLKNTSEISDMCHKPLQSDAAMRRFSVYKDVEVSEQQLERGQTRDARTALSGMRAKYGL